MLRKPSFALFEDDERTILADVGTGKSIAGAGDGAAPPRASILSSSRSKTKSEAEGQILDLDFHPHLNGMS